MGVGSGRGWCGTTALARSSGAVRNSALVRRQSRKDGGAKEDMHNFSSYLETSSRGVALLLLGAIGASLATGALAARRLSLAAGHFQRILENKKR